MKIYYVVKEFSAFGGTERIVTDKMNWLANHGYNIGLVTINQNHKQFPYQLDSRIKHFDLAIDIHLQKGRRLYKRLYYFIKNNHLLKSRLKRLLRQEMPDVCISLCSSELSVLANMNDGSIHIAEIHSSHLENNYINLPKTNFRYWVNKYYAKKSPLLLKRFDKFVVLSQIEKESWNLPNVKVIPNFINVSATHISVLDNNNVAIVARLVKVKNIESALRIWKIIINQLSGWKLNIYGEGPEKTKLEKYAEFLGISDSVIFHGRTDDVQRVYRDSSLLFLTSHFECFPLVPIEAQNNGIPCIVFKCNEVISDIVQDGKSGFVIEPGNEHAFAERALQLMKDYKVRKQFGVLGAELSKKFSAEKVMPVWVELFQSLCTSKTKQSHLGN